MKVYFVIKFNFILSHIIYIYIYIYIYVCVCVCTFGEKEQIRKCARILKSFPVLETREHMSGLNE